MIYLSLSNSCNYKCPCCPCSDHNIESSVTYEAVADKISKEAAGPRPPAVTLSGGEPTIHPDFLKIMKLLYENRIPVTILTNSSRLADADFNQRLLKAYPATNNISIITTLYNVDPMQHDAETGVQGSFQNSVDAVHIWSGYGARVTVKHCITGRNYGKLSEFYRFVNETFDQSIKFQLSGIDYIGMTKEWVLSSKLTCRELRPYLDSLLEDINRMKAAGKDRRVVYIACMPLCAASLKYKNYFIRNKDMMPFGYLSKKKNVKTRGYDSVKDAPGCLTCLAYDECAGTYKSAFDVMGDELVIPFYSEEKTCLV